MGQTIRGMVVLALALAAAVGTAEGRAQAPSGFSIQKNVLVGTKHCDVVTWTDANGKQRSVSLVRADGDHAGFVGGYITQYSYVVDNTQITGSAVDDGLEGVSGIGCAVNHHDNTASSSKSDSTGATTGFVFEGANHCLWRFHSNFGANGVTMGLTIDWLISQGRNDVLWAVSYDASGATPDFYWDARGPYFQFDWDGAGNFYGDAISGIRWGDTHKFRTTTYNTANSAWDYVSANTVPYMSLYKDASLGNIEAGVVQTQTWQQQDAAGWNFGGGSWSNGAGGTTGTGMPQNFTCPFQLNAYEGYGGEKLAWGTNFGFVGARSYNDNAGGARSGYPHQGYSTWIVLNKYTDGLTDALVNSATTVQQTTLTATAGSIVTSGPRHANLTGNANYQPAGWNHVYGAWSVNANASNAATFNVNIASGTLLRPLFVINNYTAAQPPATLTLGGTALVSGTDYTASVDAAGQKLWITLNRNLTGATNTLNVGGGPAAPPPPIPPPPAPAPGPAPASSGGGGGGGGRCGCGSTSPSLFWILPAAGVVALLLSTIKRT